MSEKISELEAKRDELKTQRDELQNRINERTMRHKGCTLIGRNGSDYFFADSVFDHGDGFKGVTGFVVRPVCTKEWEWAEDRENVAERYDDVFNKFWDGKGSGSRCKSTGRFISARETAFNAWIDLAIAVDGIDHLMFDGSYVCDASDIFDRLGVEHETTDCSGYGRIFSKDSDYEELYNLSAWVAVRSLEAGHCSAEWAGNTIFGKAA